MGFKKRIARLLADWLREELRDELALTRESSTWQLGDEGMVLTVKETTRYDYYPYEGDLIDWSELPGAPSLEFDYYPAVEDN